MVDVELWIDNGNGYVKIYVFQNPFLDTNKSSGITKMPIPATGDAPMLMNMEGMSEDVSVRFTITDRNDNCGLSGSGTYYSFDNGTSLSFGTDGILYYNANGTSYNMNTIWGQYMFLKDWGCTGEIGNYYQLKLNDGSSVYTFDGIPSTLRLSWRAGEMKIDGDIKFLIGTVIA